MACLLIMDHLSADRTHYIMMSSLHPPSSRPCMPVHGHDVIVIVKSSLTFVFTALIITRWRKLELLICRQYLPPYPSPLKQQLLTSYHDTSQLCNVHITSDLVSNVLPVSLFRRVPVQGGEARGGAGARGQHHWSVVRLLS